jgi:peptidoglycan/xylan/chitin deacetylase (PgdA/CDA1 family)
MVASFDAAFTVDLEPDCPPFLRGFRGVEQGLPRLLDVLVRQSVRATFFTTGEVARNHPDAVRSVIDGGHELACHGMTHTAFTEMTRDAARLEIEESAEILRAFAPVTSFRAPYLKFPDEYLDLVADAEFQLDSSQAKYKRAYYTSKREGKTSLVKRIPASITSSALRIPKLLRDTWLRLLHSPVVLFVHPWEFVDLRHEKIRYDCRFRTGDTALHCVEDVLASMKSRGARFTTMRDLGRKEGADFEFTPSVSEGHGGAYPERERGA